MNHIFYHAADLDGHCSGAIAKLIWPDGELHPIDYGDAFPWGAMHKNDTVVMVDFSIPEMERLDRKCNLIWVDHHISAITRFKDLDIAGNRRTDRSACRIMWDFIYRRPPNAIVDYISDYDTFKLQYSNTLQVQMALRSYETDPVKSNYLTDLILTPSPRQETLIKRLADEGCNILRYQKQRNKQTINNGMPAEICGHQCWFINAKRDMIEIKDLPDGYNLLVTAVYKIGGWEVNLYSQDVDCQEIAVKCGGGGHRGAAGFRTNDLWTIVKLEADNPS